MGAKIDPQIQIWVLNGGSKLTYGWGNGDQKGRKIGHFRPLLNVSHIAAVNGTQNTDDDEASPGSFQNFIIPHKLEETGKQP